MTRCYDRARRFLPMIQEPRRPYPSAGERIVYELARDRIGAQLSQIDGLDSKLASFLGFGGTLVGIGAAVLALRDDTPPLSTVFLVAAAIFLYAVLAGICLIGYRLQDWRAGPKLEDAWALARKHPEPVLYWWAAEGYTRFYRANRALLKPKIVAGQIGVWLLTAEAGSLTIGLLIAALD